MKKSIRKIRNKITNAGFVERVAREINRNLDCWDYWFGYSDDDFHKYLDLDVYGLKPNARYFVLDMCPVLQSKKQLGYVKKTINSDYMKKIEKICEKIDNGEFWDAAQNDYYEKQRGDD